MNSIDVKVFFGGLRAQASLLVVFFSFVLTAARQASRLQLAHMDDFWGGFKVLVFARVLAGSRRMLRDETLFKEGLLTLGERLIRTVLLRNRINYDVVIFNKADILLVGE